MEIFMTSVSVLLLSYLFVKLLVGHIRAEKMPDKLRVGVMLTLLAEIIVLILCLSARSSMVETAFFISFGMAGLFVATLSFVPKNFAVRVIGFLLSIETFYVLYRVLSVYAVLPVPSETVFLYGIMAVPVVVLAGYAVSLSFRIADTKYVLRSGSVWNSICIIVDVIYLTAFFIYTWIFAMAVINFKSPPVLLAALFSVMMLSVATALVKRMETSSLFVLWTRHERRIVESMKLTNADMTTESPGVEALYRNIYDRVLEYFEKNRPYLNPDLTINDIVNSLYTNKVYISKAICAYTGRNFCQFVNYYRIAYAVELFRSNPNMKIVDISSRSGFNSSVSFTMAFRLFMGDKPSDWFRRERAILQKQKGISAR